MTNKEKVALFDFCETIANFQTADTFVHYVRGRTDNKLMIKKEKIRKFLRNIKALAILDKLFRHSSINKRLVLWQLKGFDKNELEIFAKSYYYDVIKKNFITEVIDELRNLKQNNWRIIIISAGYEIYLKYFCFDFGIPLENLISVKIKYKEDRCLGIFDGGDRLWDKTKKLDALLNRKNIESIAFSDSISDLPMLLWADEGCVVRRADKRSWAHDYKFKEILWHKK